MKTQLARDRARDQLMYAPRLLVADDLKSNRLTQILPTFQTVGLTIDKIYPHRSNLLAKVSKFVDLLLKHFKENAARPDRSELPA